jgi:predicted dehydrogenase
MQKFKAQPEARIVAVCDVHAERLARAREIAGGEQVKPFRDFRQLLDDKEIDAVIVATPGHWHVLPTIMACQAGKDVYVEKPLGTSVAEGRAAVTAARKYNRVVQIGTQQKSWDLYREAVEVIRAGKLGAITMVEIWDNENHFPGYGAPPDAPVPPGLDWDLWLGPAPAHAYNPNRFDHHYWFFDYGGAWPLDWAVHHYDIVHWAMDATAPLSATASGGKLAFGPESDDRQWPDTFCGVLEYGPTPVAPRGFVLQYTTRSGAQGRDGHGKAFYGTDAAMYLNRGGFQIVGETRKGKKVVADSFHRGEPEDQASANHARNFLQAVMSRSKPLADIEVGHLSSNPGHLLNIAWRIGRKITWDAARETIPGDSEAVTFLSREYRAPWKLEV